MATISNQGSGSSVTASLTETRVNAIPPYTWVIAKIGNFGSPERTINSIATTGITWFTTYNGAPMHLFVAGSGFNSGLNTAIDTCIGITGAAGVAAGAVTTVTWSGACDSALWLGELDGVLPGATFTWVSGTTVTAFETTSTIASTAGAQSPFAIGGITTGFGDGPTSITGGWSLGTVIGGGSHADITAGWINHPPAGPLSVAFTQANSGANVFDLVVFSDPPVELSPFLRPSPFGPNPSRFTPFMQAGTQVPGFNTASADATLAVTAAFVSDSSLAKSSDATTTTTAALSATAAAVKTSDATVSTTATLTAAGTTAKPASASLSTTASFTAAANVAGSTPSGTLSTTAAFTAQAVVTRMADAALNVVTTITAAMGKTSPPTGGLAVTAGLTASATVTRFASAAFTAGASFAASAAIPFHSVERFYGPTVTEQTHAWARNALYRFFTQQRGVTVVLYRDGTHAEMESPQDDMLTAPEVLYAFRGGYTYTVTPDQKAALNAAGYTTTTELVPA